MKVGTKSLLFGVHNVIIHPVFVFLGWIKLYGFTFNIKILICIFIHDLGYFGKLDMDDTNGMDHPYLGARIANKLFDRKNDKKWFLFCLLHSRSLSKKLNLDVSPLCYADKYGACLMPLWIITLLSLASGEILFYMKKDKVTYSDAYKWWRNTLEENKKEINKIAYPAIQWVNPSL